MSLRRHAKLLKELKELREELIREGSPARCATFREVEEWAGRPLPASAYRHRAWWSNNNGNYSNSLKPWDLARLSTADVDMREQTVWFRLSHRDVEQARKNGPSAVSVLDRLRTVQRAREREPNAPQSSTGLSDVSTSYIPQHRSGPHPLRGALKGTLRIVAGTDLTKPADPEWAD